MSTKPATRQAKLAAIHMAQKALGMDQYDAMAVKMNVVGTSSCGDMTDQQLSKYLAHLSGLQASAAIARGEKPAYVPKRPALHRTTADGSDDRWHKARALWHALATAGVVRTDTDAALMAYVQRQTRMTHWRFLSTWQVNDVVESLKKWCDRKDIPTTPEVAR